MSRAPGRGHGGSEGTLGLAGSCLVSYRVPGAGRVGVGQRGGAAPTCALNARYGHPWTRPGSVCGLWPHLSPGQALPCSGSPAMHSAFDIVGTQNRAENETAFALKTS